MCPAPRHERDPVWTLGPYRWSREDEVCSWSPSMTGKRDMETVEPREKAMEDEVKVSVMLPQAKDTEGCQ